MTQQNEYQPESAYHPGVDLNEKLIELGIGPKEFSVRSGKPEKTITAILKGESSITPEMAVQFENVLNIPARFWLSRQYQYDEYLAREERKELLLESIDWAKQFPVAEMVKRGWLLPQKTWEEKTQTLLNFFGISNHIAWKNYYLDQKLKIAFRISLADTTEAHAISAWLRKGELSAAELSTTVYSEEKFKDILPKLKNIMAHQPDDFFIKMQKLCLDNGVKVVYTPCLPKVPIFGSTRWLNDVPLIQLTARYKRNDIFWFTFFHEVGHILLHGKKDVFLENINYSHKDPQKEIEADSFAVNWTLTGDEFQEILSQLSTLKGNILYFAQKFNTHPSIIIGRLQHDKYIPYSSGIEYFKSIDLN